MFSRGRFYVFWLFVAAIAVSVFSDDDTAWAILVVGAATLTFLVERDAD